MRVSCNSRTLFFNELKRNTSSVGWMGKAKQTNKNMFLSFLLMPTILLTQHAGKSIAGGHVTGGTEGQSIMGLGKKKKKNNNNRSIWRDIE